MVEADPVPRVCRMCAERQACLAKGEGEWCCDECEHLAERFVLVDGQEPEDGRASMS